SSSTSSFMSVPPPGIVCTDEEYALSLKSPGNPYPPITCLTRGQSFGVFLMIEAASISTLAVLFIFALMIRNYYRYSKRDPGGNWRLLRQPMDIFMVFMAVGIQLSLLCSDLLQAIPLVLTIKWVNEGKLYTGNYCTAQGAISQMGETGVAIATFVIAIHTFVAVMWRKGTRSRLAAFIVVGFLWAFVIIFVGISVGIHRRTGDLYDTPTPFWCWIGGKFPDERIAGEYFWMWLALITSLVVYIPLGLWSRGYISVDPKTWWKFRFHRRVQVQDSDGSRHRALAMLAYPLVYAIIVGPTSVIRWINFGLETRGKDTPTAVSFIASVLFSLSGFLNVTLLLTTRPQLLLLNMPRARNQSEESTSSMPSRPSTNIARSSPGAILGTLKTNLKAPNRMKLGQLDEDTNAGWDLPLETRRSALSLSESTATDV
ncbi:hypothetical protein EW146_g9510, partial [Bondarzewia mesenterica]